MQLALTKIAKHLADIKNREKFLLKKKKEKIITKEESAELERCTSILFDAHMLFLRGLY